MNHLIHLARPHQSSVYAQYDFVYFLEDPKVESRFKQLLSSLITVDFMGNVDWLLGTPFSMVVLQ